MALHPRPQGGEADVRRVIRLVVHPLRRAMAEQHVRGRKALGQHGGLLLRVLVGAVPVPHTPLEPREAPPAHLRPRQMKVLNADRRQRVLAVVVAVHPQAWEIERSQGGDPSRIEVAEGDDRVGLVRGDQLGRIGGRRFVGEGEEAHHAKCARMAAVTGPDPRPRGWNVRALRLLPLTAVLVLAAAAPASAQSAQDIDVIASGLDNPRHVAVSRDGDVYVAESGTGGGDPTTSRSCFDGAEGPSCTGATGAVTRISRHGQKRIATGLASFAPYEEPLAGHAAIGPHGIFVKGDNVYVTNGGPAAPTRGDPRVPVLRDPTLVAEDPVSALYGLLLQVRRHGGVREIADLWAFERDVNPDQDVGTPGIDSNPVDVYTDGRRFFVADAGGNTVLRASRRGEVSAVSVFPNIDMPHPFIPGEIVPMNAVPTGVVKGPDGALYVSQLTGFPFPLGGAKVFRVDPRSGEFTTYATGFTNAMDLDFGRDGTLYVLEIDSNSLLADGEEGGIWAVPPGGGTPQRIELPAGTLTTPGGIAVGRRGDLFVSNNATSPGIGEVLEIELDD
jgi:hypothetical protein